MIGFQAFLNMLCVIGFAPTTGKPLPFISSGGSSVVATLIMVGFILAGSENDALPDEYEKRRDSFVVATSKENKTEKEEKKSKKIPVERFSIRKINKTSNDRIPKRSYRTSETDVRKTTYSNNNKTKKYFDTSSRLKKKGSYSSEYKSSVYRRKNSNLNFIPQSVNFKDKKESKTANKSSLTTKRRGRK